MQKTKKILIEFIVAVVFFIISLIVQYYLSTVLFKSSILIAIFCAIIASLITISIISMNSTEEKFSLSIFIFDIIMAYIGITFIMLLSTIGNMICEGVCTICFIIGLILFMIDAIYLSIKELIKEFKKYKENQ